MQGGHACEQQRTVTSSLSLRARGFCALKKVEGLAFFLSGSFPVGGLRCCGHHITRLQLFFNISRVKLAHLALTSTALTASSGSRVATAATKLMLGVHPGCRVQRISGGHRCPRGSPWPPAFTIHEALDKRGEVDLWVSKRARSTVSSLESAIHLVT
jgi:hypothetical protein